MNAAHVQARALGDPTRQAVLSCLADRAGAVDVAERRCTHRHGGRETSDV